MKALAVHPGVAGSARVDDVPDPEPGGDDLLVRGILVGICGTDREIVAGAYGEPPPGRARLVLGHESLGQVVSAPNGSGFSPGEFVVGIVRRPDPVPCQACAIGEWDMCLNGRFFEHGIKGLDGFASESYALDPAAAIAVPASLRQSGVLIEPTSVVAKAWEQIERIGSRAAWFPRRVLVTGAGPIGLLAALLAVQRGFEVHVLDVVTTGPKPGLVADVGGIYHSSDLGDVARGSDIIVECSGAPDVVFEVIASTPADAIVCLTGVSTGQHRLRIDASALNRELVLENDVVFGSVNANRRHYQAAIDALRLADLDWLARLITRRLPLSDWSSAIVRLRDDVKVTLNLESID
jgi:threonine dehydrogenase-like Zn-dependent dehydrogenase